jgi:hypothetical protein
MHFVLRKTDPLKRIKLPNQQINVNKSDGEASAAVGIKLGGLRSREYFREKLKKLS